MKAKIILGLISLLVLIVSNIKAQEFTLISTTANTGMNYVVMDLPQLNGNPLAIIVATPLGDTEKLNPHPIGVWYYNGKWNINNTDGGRFVPGLKYKIQYFPKPGVNQFLHIVTQENLGREGSYINNPALNNNPKARFRFLQNHAPESRPAYDNNRNQVKALYNQAAGEWYLTNVNGKDLNRNTAYNIVIFSEGNDDLNTSTSPTSSTTGITSVAPKTSTQPIPVKSPVDLIPNVADSSQKPCIESDIYKKVGGWGKQSSDSLANADPGFPRDQYKPILAKSQTVIELLKRANPQPTGIQASAHREMSGKSYTANGALKFGTTAAYFTFICLPDTPGDPERGQIIPGGETDTWIYIQFNSLGWLANDEMSLGRTFPTADGKIIYYYPKQTGDLKGLKLLKPEIHNNRSEEAVIITAGDASPYKPVTREEFLQGLLNLHRNKLKKMQGEPRLSAIEEDDIAKLEAVIARMSPAERQMQAVILDPYALPKEMFVSESRTDSKKLVTIDRSFFNPALPRQTIQLITVYWCWNEKDPAKAELIRKFKQNFDFEALRQMLGK